MSIMPDETKTTEVADLIANGEVIERIRVFPFQHRRWLIVADIGGMGEPIAECTLPDYASAVAHAVAGAVDCDLELGDALPAALDGQEDG